ncbi:hypothetical protein HXX76_000564 [Chlamydomonas incerta]|uniref:Protein kinase domain-containing protein n=1 Tax=Chlamydomonas incerta TaxID=51695 RepID=A0A835WEK4_CHLIN|nr:hypothetical protein HXX76_000564 [Chlamydomonas incerta]|eukprot:KAG2445961.1 hypothetical protein HXX76_000564 [Chlamydomonas incerta]
MCQTPTAGGSQGTEPRFRIQREYKMDSTEPSDAATTGNSGSSGSSSVDDLSGSWLLDEYLTQHGLSRCVPVRLLGQGAMGRVELVHIAPPPHQLDAAPIVAARKTQPCSQDPHLRAKEDAVFGLELEGLAAGRGSPFFVRQLAVAAHGDRHELLLELAEGGTLEEELSEALSAAPPGPLKQLLLAPERIANVAASLLSGLVEMHEQGLGHFDIKPPNLLLTREGRLLIGDTGCAIRADSEGNVPAPLPTGTPVFAAPETRAPHGVFQAAKADAYSVGVLLALTCKDPVQRPSPRQALEHPFLASVDVGALAPLRCPGLPPS